MDGGIMAYDSQFYQLLGSIADSKNYHLFAVNEKASNLLAINKKRLLNTHGNLLDLP